MQSYKFVYLSENFLQFRFTPGIPTHPEAHRIARIFTADVGEDIVLLRVKLRDSDKWLFEIFLSQKSLESLMSYSGYINLEYVADERLVKIHWDQYVIQLHKPAPPPSIPPTFLLNDFYRRDDCFDLQQIVIVNHLAVRSDSSLTIEFHVPEMSEWKSAEVHCKTERATGITHYYFGPITLRKIRFNPTIDTALIDYVSFCDPKIDSRGNCYSNS